MRWCNWNFIIYTTLLSGRSFKLGVKDTANVSKFFIPYFFFITWLQSIKETVFRACVDVSCRSFDYIMALGLIICQYIE